MATTTRNRRPTREAPPKARNDAYVGLLFISFVALIVSSILLYLDFNQYGGKSPPKLNVPAFAPALAVPGPPAPDATPVGEGAPMGSGTEPAPPPMPMPMNPGGGNPGNVPPPPMPMNPGGGGNLPPPPGTGGGGGGAGANTPTIK